MIVIVSACLTGCIQSSTVMVDERTAIISTKAPKFAPGSVAGAISALTPDDNATMIEAALKEAADVTLKRGYRYFELLDATDRTRVVSFDQSGHANCTGTVTNNGVAGSPQPFEAQCRGYAPRVTTLAEPGLDLIVRMHREGEIDPKKEGIIDATWIVSQE